MSLRHDLASLGSRLIRTIRGKPGTARETVALDDVSFEANQGEALAIIGPNGAGKTTLLKLVSRITYPSAGRVRVRGRVGALIDVGAGLHPELSGRENIWLYGRILGMSRQDIAKRFDTIVDFAEIGYALHKPVKYYSSGMQLRLGFSIASHIDPDVFLVDEALAVGDAGFQVKCVERMTRLISEGRTLLFVSHNLSAVEAICQRGLFLLDGRIEALGRTHDALRAYLDWVDTRHLDRIGRGIQVKPSRFLRIEHISFHDATGAERSAYRTGEDLEIRLQLHAETPIRRPMFSIGITDGRPGNLILCSMLVDGRAPEVIEGPCTVSCRIRQLPLLPRVYQTWCSVCSSLAYGDILDYQIVGTFRVAEGPSGMNGPAAVAYTGTDAPIHTDYEWEW